MNFRYRVWDEKTHGGRKRLDVKFWGQLGGKVIWEHSLRLAKNLLRRAVIDG